MDFVIGTLLKLGKKTKFFRGVSFNGMGDSRCVNMAFYPSQTAMVGSAGRIALPRELTKQLEYGLFNAAGLRMNVDDNVVVGVESGDGNETNVMYFHFTEFTTYIGTELYFNKRKDRMLEYPVEVVFRKPKPFPY